MSKKNKIAGILLVVVLLMVLLGLKSRAEAESDWWPTIPEPSQSWDDYMEEHPIPTVEPTNTAEPSSNPLLPPMLGATNPYLYGRFRGYRLEPRADGTYNYNYQYLVSPYPVRDTLPSWQRTTAVVNNGLYTWSSADAQGGAMTLVPADSAINCIDNYIVMEFLLYFSNYSNGAVEGMGLDENKMFLGRCTGDFTAFYSDNNQLLSNLPVRANLVYTYDDGSRDVLDPEFFWLNDFKTGIPFPVQSRVAGRMVYSAHIYFYIGFTPDMVEYDPNTRAIPRIIKIQQSAPLVVEGKSQQAIVTNNSLLDAILEVPRAIASVFVPTEQMFQDWIQDKIDNAPDDSSTMLYYQAYLQILNTMANSDGEPNFHLKLPPLSIRVAGVSYQYFDGIDFDMQEANIQLEGQSGSLFYYSRLVGDVIIVSGFVFGFVYGIWKRLFDVSFAAGTMAYHKEDDK